MLSLFAKKFGHKKNDRPGGYNRSKFQGNCLKILCNLFIESFLEPIYFLLGCSAVKFVEFVGAKNAKALKCNIAAGEGIVIFMAINSLLCCAYNHYYIPVISSICQSRLVQFEL